MGIGKELKQIHADLIHTNPISMGDLLVTRDIDSDDGEGMGITLFNKSNPADHTFLNEMGFQELKKISVELKNGFKPWKEVLENEEDHKESWWTVFLFKDIPNPNDLHVTHKYFGDIGEEFTEENLESVIETIDGYFENKEFHSFQLDFSKEEMFGPDKDVRVLTPSSLSDIEKDEYFLLDLKGELDDICPDDWPDYKPHVSTEEITVVDRPIVGFALMKGSRPFREYWAKKD